MKNPKRFFRFSGLERFVINIDSVICYVPPNIKEMENPEECSSRVYFSRSEEDTSGVDVEPIDKKRFEEWLDSWGVA